MIDAIKSSFTRFGALPLGAARWTAGFWADRFDCCRDAMVPAMGELMTGSQRVRFLGNFEVAAGVVNGVHRGPKWNDGDFYKWLEAAAAVYAISKDPALDRLMDEVIAVIASTQRDDGYIHTDVQIAQRNGNAKQPFDNPMDFEMYNMGHLMTAACIHHSATGKCNLLALARKSAEFLAGIFANPTPDQARHGICPSHLMGLIDLYHATDEPRYLELAIKLLNMRDLVTSGDDDNQDRIPFRQQRTAHGHAVRATYLYAGAADIYAQTGDPLLIGSLEPIWQDLVSRKLYITGGCGALFDGASPDGSEDQRTITRVHQSFGRDYQLPQSTSHNETCAAIGNLLWNWRMLLLTGEARFADVVEQTLYNSVLAGVSLDGTRFFYTNTLRQLDPMPVPLRWPRHRQKFIGCFCCPPNVVRTIAQSARYAYAMGERSIAVILFGASALKSDIATLHQETNYPWDGKVRITIDASDGKPFTLKLRIPAWAQDCSARINGKTIADALQPGSFLKIDRTWAAGDMIELDLPMPVRLIESNPYVEETRGQVAVMRGPIVYCLESVDLPANVRLLDVSVPRNAKFTRVADPLLPGITLLEFEALATAADTTPTADWGNTLYRDVTDRPQQRIRARLAPYFAWDNRGDFEMSVWLPVTR